MSQLFPPASGAATLSDAQALAQFQTLSRQQQLPLISQVLLDELNAAGLAQNNPSIPKVLDPFTTKLAGGKPQFDAYTPGYEAINTLFPTADAAGNAISYQGDINMFFSQIKTEQGGNINLLDPGGKVVVGVPNPPAILSSIKQDDNFNPPLSADANLGLLVLAQGAIEGFANGDFDVNQSRVLTLQGGDIILWSSDGSIDAGKGAKTAQGAPPPVIETDNSGNVFVNPVGAVNGSGIGQLLTLQDITPGIVDLVAPTGIVNAGDAGIRVAGNLNIAAVAVLNVGNIKVGGTSSGVPVSDAGALSGALSGANSLGDAGKNAAAQLAAAVSESAAAAQQLADSFKPSFVTVKLFCLGQECDSP